jgi:hypothetical protein
MSQPYIPTVGNSAVGSNALLREEPIKVVAGADGSVVVEMAPEQAEAIKKEAEAKEAALRDYAGRVIFKLLEPHLGHSLSVDYQLHAEDIPDDDSHYKRKLDSITLYCKTCKHPIVIVGPKANSTPGTPEAAEVEAAPAKEE